MTNFSLDVADEEQFFFTQADNNIESEEQTLQGKEQSRQAAKEWMTNEEPASLRTSIKEFAKIDGDTTSYSINRNKANETIQVEQGLDLNFQISRLSVEVLLTTDGRHKHCKVNEDRIILKDGLLFGNTTEKRVESNTTKSSYQHNS